MWKYCFVATAVEARDLTGQWDQPALYDPGSIVGPEHSSATMWNGLAGSYLLFILFCRTEILFSTKKGGKEVRGGVGAGLSVLASDVSGDVCANIMADIKRPYWTLVLVAFGRHLSVLDLSEGILLEIAHGSFGLCDP